MIKLVALDLDGTLLEPSGLISQPTLEQLKRINDQGVKIAIATGRPFARTLDPLRENRLYPGGTYPQLLICEERDIYELMNGEYLPWEQNGAALDEELQNLFLGRRLVAQLEQEAPNLEFAINNNYSQTTRGFVETYFVYPHQADQAFAFLTELTQNTGLKVTRNRRNVCLRSKNVGKGTVLKKVAAHYGLDLGEVLAVGDSNNDFEMLSSGVRAATTRNADGEIKELVSKVDGFIAQAEYSLGVGEIIKKSVS